MYSKIPPNTAVAAACGGPPVAGYACRRRAALRRLIVSMLLAAWLLMFKVPAIARGADEYAVKAAFLVKFSQYVTWPAEAFAGPAAPFTIGVLGDDAFGADLDADARSVVVGPEKRKIVIKRSRKPADLKDCQILFISKSERAQAPQILAGLGQAKILTVSESDGFAANGGIVNFYIADDATVRFEINNDVAVRHGLTIDPRLLRLARPVH